MCFLLPNILILYNFLVMKCNFMKLPQINLHTWENCLLHYIPLSVSGWSWLTVVSLRFSWGSKLDILLVDVNIQVDVSQSRHPATLILPHKIIHLAVPSSDSDRLSNIMYTIHDKLTWQIYCGELVETPVCCIERHTLFDLLLPLILHL
jgi:hypothetical protein